LKRATVLGMLCICKHPQSRWTRQSNFARMWRVRQEAKSDRALSSSMIANGSALAVRRANRPVVRGEFGDEMLADTLRQALAEQGAIVPRVEVQRVASIPKTAAGKAPLIKSNLSRSLPLSDALERDTR
jgi:hypothetical protein